MKFLFTRVSGNKKTGPIPTTMSEKSTCPRTCPLNGNGCYAQGGPTNIHWTRLSNGENPKAHDQKGFYGQIKALPGGQLWRHNVAGDLPHNPQTGAIDAEFLTGLVRANKGKRGFTYSHHVLTTENIRELSAANAGGFTVNVSANTLTEAVSIKKNLDLPTVCVLPLDAPNQQEHDGIKVVACPAEKSDKVSCSNCGLCAVADRDYIIGFRAHGVSKKRVDIIARG